MVYSIRSDNWGASSRGVELNDLKYFEPDVSPSINIWYQVTIPLHPGEITKVNVWTSLVGTYGSANSYLDDVYVIAE